MSFEFCQCQLNRSDVDIPNDDDMGNIESIGRVVFDACYLGSVHITHDVDLEYELQTLRAPRGQLDRITRTMQSQNACTSDHVDCG